MIRNGRVGPRNEAAVNLRALDSPLHENNLHPVVYALYWQGVKLTRSDRTVGIGPPTVGARENRSPAFPPADYPNFER